MVVKICRAYTTVKVLLHTLGTFTLTYGSDDASAFFRFSLY